MSTKARRTRSRFQRRLEENLGDACRAHGLDCTTSREWSRLYLTAGDPEANEIVGRVFGISSFSLIEGRCEARLPNIVEVGTRLYAEAVKGRRYAVRARRTGRHDFGSYDVQRDLGTALNPGATVDLSDPEVEVRLEVRDRWAYFVGTPIRGAGGLPLGVQGRAISLLSGGYDSAVAAWMTLRRGIELEYVFCNLGGAAYKRLVIEVTKVLADLWSYGTRPRLHVVDFASVMEDFTRTVKPSYWQVTLKRLMYEAAANVAEETGADAIVTGESVGQVSSQTLANLRAIDEVATLPVLRPLVGFDKEQIIEKAREIGTYELSSRVREYCAIVPVRPVTATTPEAARRQEEEVDRSVLAEAVAGREILGLRDVDAAQLVGSHLFVGEIPDGAVVIDTRDTGSYLAWHWPGAAHLEFEDLAEKFGRLDRKVTYVLYCGEGIRTAHLVERMQGRGYEAYSFRGGVRALRQYHSTLVSTGGGEGG